MRSRLREYCSGPPPEFYSGVDIIHLAGARFGHLPRLFHRRRPGKEESPTISICVARRDTPNIRAEISNSGVAFDGTVFVDEEEPDIVTARLGLVYKMGRDARHYGMKDNGGDDKLKVISYAGIDVAKDIWTVVFRRVDGTQR